MNLCWKGHLYTNERTNPVDRQRLKGKCKRRVCTCAAKDCACLVLLMSLKSAKACSFQWNTNMGTRANGSTITSNYVPRRFAWKTCNQKSLHSLMGTFTILVRGGGYELISTRNCARTHGLLSPGHSRYLRSRSHHHHSKV